jgi:hypothetical protein
MNNFDKYKLITELYRRDERVKNFILSFFKTRRGVRCSCFQDKSRGVHYRYFYNEQKALGKLTFDNFWDRVGNAKGMAIFFYEYIFDEWATDPGVNHWEYVIDDNGDIVVDNKGKPKVRIFHNDSIIGSSIVFEIDAPSVPSVDKDDRVEEMKNSGKIDFFDSRYYEEFMWVKARVEQKLDMLGAKYNCLFSGNGIYIIVETAYFDEIENMNLYKMRKTKQNMFSQIQPFPPDSNKKGHPVIDLRDIGWALYFKVPFSFHETRDRMVIPISKGYINREWLDRVTDMNYEYAMTKENIDDILGKCGWIFDIW